MKNKLLALLTASLMLTTAAPLPPVQAADKVVTDPIIGTLPEWVPQDFGDAMQFYNTHGKSYVADNVICLVRPMLQYKEDDYQVSLSGSMTLVNTPAGSQPKIYELEIPENPEGADEETVLEYTVLCEKIGVDPNNYSFFESYSGCKTQYAFEVELYRVLEGYDLSVTWSEKDGDGYKTTEKFSFENKYGKTVETDIYSWLPDCQTEYLENYEYYGTSYVHGQYLAYCSSINPSEGMILNMEQDGEGKVEEVMQSDCSKFELIPSDGSTPFSTIVYQAVSDGKFDIAWTIGKTTTEELFGWHSGIYEIKNNCSVIVDLTPVNLHKGEMKVTLVDYDTGEPIVFDDNTSPMIWTDVKYNIPKETITTGPCYTFAKNPAVISEIGKFFEADSFSFGLSDHGLPKGYSLPAEDENTVGWIDGKCVPEDYITVKQDKNTAEVVFKLKYSPTGDVNDDGEFSISDLIMLKRWLLGKPGSELVDWKAADFTRDGKLNVFDFTLMKREFINKGTKYVEPDNRVQFGLAFYVREDNLKLYMGPDESYRSVAVIPNDERLYELGFQNNSDNWLFTEYNGQYGWIKTVNEEDNTPTIWFEAIAKKPVIYLYPEEETDVHVELNLKEADLSTTYPRYNNGWDVTAYPGGSLLNKADGTHHKYLFWDAVNCRTKYDFSKGFCVAGSDTESFLKEKLTYMGLTEEEMNEFIVYWLPQMEHNKYNLISFQGDAYTNSAELNITPKPDSLLRVFMTYIPLEDEVDIEPQQFETFERKGFTVVEWGGSEISR